MIMCVTHLVDAVMANEQTEPLEEREEVVAANETPSVGNAINVFN